MAAPERFAEKSDLPLQRGHRPYMAQLEPVGHVCCIVAVRESGHAAGSAQDAVRDEAVDGAAMDRRGMDCRIKPGNDDRADAP